MSYRNQALVALTMLLYALPHASIERHHLLMVMRLLAAIPQTIRHGLADPEDLDARAAHLLLTGDIVDDYILANGYDINDNIRGKFDLADFTCVIRGTLEDCDAIGKLNNRAERMRMRRSQEFDE